MAGISKIMTNAYNCCIKKPVNKFTEGMCKNYQSKNMKYIAGIGIASILLKDGLGCYMYVKQSLHNKDIPEDKRKFVAALDLTNGGLMIASQLAMFFTISNSKIQGKIFDRFFGKKFDAKAKEVCEAAIKKIPKFKDIEPKRFEKIFNNFKGDAKGFFGVFTSLVAATILAKRVIVPFIATPLADKAKAWMNKDDNKNKDTFQKA